MIGSRGRHRFSVLVILTKKAANYLSAASKSAFGKPKSMTKLK